MEFVLKMIGTNTMRLIWMIIGKVNYKVMMDIQKNNKIVSIVLQVVNIGLSKQ
jgi:hypothetical protein